MTTVPGVNASVEIKSSWNMIYNIASSPDLKMLKINGRLTFDDSADRKLTVEHLFVQLGELIIGSEASPF